MMKFSYHKIALTIIFIITLSTVILVGNSRPLGRVSLGVLFSSLIWYRSDEKVSRWLALFVLWMGILIPVIWTLIKG